jgi:vacuolar-type H+-ATPase subunit E/Vma4
MVQMVKNTSKNKILNVDQKLIEEFLVLIRDRFPTIDKANYYLERTGVSGLNIAVTNQRDVITHLITVLSNHKLSPDEQRSQYHNAEEHVRRAIIEPYHKAVNEVQKKVITTLETYKSLVLPELGHAELNSAPNLVSINARLRKVAELTETGRNAKRLNVWNEQWDSGVQCLVEARDELEKLLTEMEQAIGRCSGINSRRKNVLRWIISVLLSLTGLAFGVAVKLGYI